jgi:hypothetical protein
MTTHRKPVKPETIVKPAPKPVEPRRSEADIQALRELRSELRDAEKGVEALRAAFEAMRDHYSRLCGEAHDLIADIQASHRNVTQERITATLEHLKGAPPT